MILVQLIFFFFFCGGEFSGLFFPCWSSLLFVVSSFSILHLLSVFSHFALCADLQLCCLFRSVSFLLLAIASGFTCFSSFLLFQKLSVDCSPVESLGCFLFRWPHQHLLLSTNFIQWKQNPEFFWSQFQCVTFIFWSKSFSERWQNPEFFFHNRFQCHTFFFRSKSFSEKQSNWFLLIMIVFSASMTSFLLNKRNSVQPKNTDLHLTKCFSAMTFTDFFSQNHFSAKTQNTDFSWTKSFGVIHQRLNFVPHDRFCSFFLSHPFPFFKIRRPKVQCNETVSHSFVVFFEDVSGQQANLDCFLEIPSGSRWRLAICEDGKKGWMRRCDDKFQLMEMYLEVSGVGETASESDVVRAFRPGIHWRGLTRQGFK